MALREITRDVTSKVEAASGYPVHVREEPSLGTLSKVKMATEAVPAHVISWNPSSNRAPDYHIVWQCGFILRLHQNPPEERYSFGTSDHGRSEVEWLLGGPKGIVSKLGLDKAQLRDQIYNGLMTHLRSVPMGMRVDQWIIQEYPELSDLQQEVVDKQLQQNLSVLNSEIKRTFPKKILDSTVAISSAFAEFWAGQRDMPQIALPYKATGKQKKGKVLLGIFNKVPATPDKDRELVDAWAKALNLSGWYEWTPYKAGR